MKTGYTDAAGYCLLATAQREFPNLGPTGGVGKRRLLTVVLNTTSMEARASESQKLLNWGFQAFDTVRLFDDGKAIVTAPVWKGTTTRGQARRRRRASSSPCRRARAASSQTKVERTDPLVAPLAKGQRVGTIKVSTAGGSADRRGAAGGAWSRSSRPASSAAPGTRSGSGSSEARTPRPAGRQSPRRRHADPSSRHPLLPERRVPAAGRGQGVGARPWLHLRRRHLRGRAGLRPASCSASTSTWRASAAAWPRCASRIRTAATSGSSAAGS